MKAQQKIGNIRFLRGGIKKMIDGEKIAENTLRDRLVLTDQDDVRSAEVLETQIKAIRYYGGTPIDLNGNPFMPATLRDLLKRR